jgi:hypothetical protein
LIYYQFNKASISIIFAISWLPLNIFNILSDTDFIKPGPTYYLINAICVLFAMSSAVSNPFLYGFLNENFKSEYITLLNKCSCAHIRSNPNQNQIQNQRESSFRKGNIASFKKKKDKEDDVRLQIKYQLPQIIINDDQNKDIIPLEDVEVNEENVDGDKLINDPQQNTLDSN